MLLRVEFGIILVGITDRNTCTIILSSFLASSSPAISSNPAFVRSMAAKFVVSCRTSAIFIAFVSSSSPAISSTAEILRSCPTSDTFALTKAPAAATPAIVVASKFVAVPVSHAMTRRSLALLIYRCGLVSYRIFCLPLDSCTELSEWRPCYNTSPKVRVSVFKKEFQKLKQLNAPTA